MKRLRFVAAAAVGLMLASFPFVQYLHPRGEAHTDHEPRHGGQLGMVGDHHVELLRRDGHVEAFVSDAWRRPVRPREGWVIFDDASAEPFVWDSYRLVCSDIATARILDAVVILSDGTRLSISFDFS